MTQVHGHKLWSIIRSAGDRACLLWVERLKQKNLADNCIGHKVIDLRLSEAGLTVQEAKRILRMRCQEKQKVNRIQSKSSSLGIKKCQVGWLLILLHHDVRSEQQLCQGTGNSAKGDTSPPRKMIRSLRSMPNGSPAISCVLEIDGKFELKFRRCQIFWPVIQANCFTFSRHDTAGLWCSTGGRTTARDQPVEKEAGRGAQPSQLHHKQDITRSTI